MTTTDVRIILCASLVLAVMGVVAALRILEWSSSVFQLPIFLHQFVMHDLSGSVLCGFLLILAMLSFRRSLLPARVLDFLDERRWVIAAALAGLLVIGTLTVYHNYPLCQDEFVQLFQAKIFAMGRIWAEYPPALLDRLLPLDFFTPSRATGQVISGYWPGFSLLETPFVFIGAPWLLNPLLAAGTLLLIRCVAAELHPDTNAPSWAMLFTLASPAFIVNCISYYAMPAQLFLNLLFTTLILEKTPRRLVAAGLVGSFALLQKNPIPHILYAVPWIVWVAARRGGWRSLIWLAIGYLPLSLFLGFGWAALRFRFTAQSAAGGKTFWDELQRLPASAMARDFLRVAYYRSLALVKLAAWAVPGLVVLAGIGARRGWRDARIRVLAFSALLTFFGYLLFWPSQGHGWGYRYFHGAWGTLPLLACGLVAARKAREPEEPTPLARAAGTLAVLSLLLLNGLRLYQVDAFIDRHLSQLPRLDSDRAQVCFIRPLEGYYSIDLLQNDPFLRQKTVFVKSFGSESEKRFIAEFFPDAVPRSDAPDEAVWHIEGRLIQQWRRNGE
ncbi:MAG: hypothetical protein ACYSYV_07125 [Planctomycetota bacterium]